MSQLYFEDFAPGQQYEGGAHLLDEKAFSAFAALTGDAHPIHYDKAYAQATKFGERVAHGLLVVAMSALGATPLSARLRESMVAFAEQGFRFRRAVLIGDSVRPVFTVEATEPVKKRVRFKVEIFNGKGELAAEGFHEYVLKNRS